MFHFIRIVWHCLTFSLFRLFDWMTIHSVEQNNDVILLHLLKTQRLHGTVCKYHVWLMQCSISITDNKQQIPNLKYEFIYKKYRTQQHTNKIGIHNYLCLLLHVANMFSLFLATCNLCSLERAKWIDWLSDRTNSATTTTAAANRLQSTDKSKSNRD